MRQDKDAIAESHSVHAYVTDNTISVGIINHIYGYICIHYL